MKLTDSLRFLKGIGEKRAVLFQKLGVNTVQDLLYLFPRSYEDRTNIRAVSELEEGESVCVHVSVAGGLRMFRARTGAKVLQIRMSDGTGILQVTWFNAPYVEKMLSASESVVLFGKVGFRGRYPEMVNPVMEAADKSGKTTGKIMPVYPCTAGLNQRIIREAVQNAMKSLEDVPQDCLPDSVRTAYHLMDFSDALRQVHLPEDFSQFEAARKRLAFEEFFLMQMGIGMAKVDRRSESAPKIENVKCIADFAAGLPYQLTKAQKRVINEIAADIRKDKPMNRLIQGDVGSGKTIVAASVMYAVAQNEYQSVLMAPTEILARQHFATFRKLFHENKDAVVLVIGGQKSSERKDALQKITEGTAKIIIGTHALINDPVSFYRLGLVVTDEQHRFGVRQRTALSEKRDAVHTLVMTATPIPRTLSLVLYGDLDVSIIDELPAGRKSIKTISVNESMREKADQFVLSQIKDGRQAYFVCPLIEESEVIEAIAVEDYLKTLQNGVYRQCKLEALHGKMKPADKDAIMKRFAAGEIDALVSTTVIEVGIDVPNATVMVVENAERFGLSQLHQLRGRVGRGKWQSYCLLFCASGGKVAQQRMQAMCETEDGFKIAEKDLELRGPGEFLGTRQHGIPELRVGNPVTDMQLLKETQKAAAIVLQHDPDLSMQEHKVLKEALEHTFEKVGGVLN